MTGTKYNNAIKGDFMLDNTSLMTTGLYIYKNVKATKYATDSRAWGY